MGTSGPHWPKGNSLVCTTLSNKIWGLVSRVVIIQSLAGVFACEGW